MQPHLTQPHFPSLLHPIPFLNNNADPVILQPLGLTGSSPSTTELSRLKIKLQQSLRQFPDFPAPGILFEDILPIFKNPLLHENLITALELYILDIYGHKQRPDIIIGLEARGFLFGPSLALRLGAGFVPIRKKGKLPGQVETASYTKEYGEDHFEVQLDSIKKGQTVVIVDDIIATGTLPHFPSHHLCSTQRFR